MGGEIEIASCSANSSTKRSATSSEKNILMKQIVEAQRKLATLQNGDLEEVATEFDFSPYTIERESKVAKANAELLKQGISCQRFGQEGWRNVRKQFQDVLGKMPQDIKQRVGKDFLAANSNFKKVSDSLLQYVCGRRAEVIQQRRESYRPINRVLRQILHDIPPSETHLFMDKTLSEAVKEQGGIHKFFPVRRKQLLHTNSSGHDGARRRETARTAPSSYNAKKKKYNTNPKWNTASKGKSGNFMGVGRSQTQYLHSKKKGGTDKK
ncbi:hypothetical protein ACJJTC_003385 [Scirpophaga incertulas]